MKVRSIVKSTFKNTFFVVFLVAMMWLFVAELKETQQSTSDHINPSGGFSEFLGFLVMDIMASICCGVVAGCIVCMLVCAGWCICKAVIFVWALLCLASSMILPADKKKFEARKS